MDSIFPAMIKAKGGLITKARLSNTLLGKELYRAGLTQKAFAEKVGISARYVRKKHDFAGNRNGRMDLFSSHTQVDCQRKKETEGGAEEKKLKAIIHPLIFESRRF